MNLRDYIKRVLFEIYQDYPVVYGEPLDAFLDSADDEALVKLMVDTIKIERSKGYGEAKINTLEEIKKDRPNPSGTDWL